ncbi:hypothetical protein CBM2626_U20048 [Cupriavidus taiwanensis]|nr:hypothetical protein CBM2614_U10116 [Cupriavidus taiwanensis]SOZ73433.1 hypothetical protein CBM2615_U10110 [Cupriavidus taiwanensis]SPA03832.1 hypothetical protein CBM2626_U20048 [Cupriavidus taiwanensis]SPA11694.1 protein of unknown function [Cupriavidus taiwanensis]SPA57595.1 protein of unknown function [Cupriavidus taiwanensis]
MFLCIGLAFVSQLGTASTMHADTAAFLSNAGEQPLLLFA